jgi:NADP-dependent 3-hydroxy acid dehydrogenase YdfG
MKQVIVITGASSGFGALAARRLADAGHTVYAGMRATTGRNSTQVESVNQYARDQHVVVNGVADRVRAEMFRRIGLEDLLHPIVTHAR